MEVPEECSDIIPYTSYPNKLLALESAEDYERLGDRIQKAAANCSDGEKIRWGACHMMFPRCLMGHELYLCKDTCRGTLVTLTDLPAFTATAWF